MDPKLEAEIVALIKSEVAKAMGEEESQDDKEVAAEDMIQGKKQPGSISDLKNMRAAMKEK